MKESGIVWIGQIPEEWEVAKVNHIFEEHKQKNIGNKEKNLLSLSYGRIIRKSIDSSFGLLPESFDTYNIIQRGDIVLRLTDLQNDKRSLRVGLARENGIITSAYLTLRLKNLESNDSYMYYLLHTYDICKVFYNFGGGVRQGGTWSDIYKMELLIPPCNEQQKIADFLDKKTAQLDKVRSLLEEQIQKLKDYRASLIYETVTKGLDKTVPMKDSGIDWIGQVPEGWGVSRLKYFFDIYAGGDIDERNTVDEYSENHPYPVISNSLENEGILGYTNKFRFQGDSVTVTGRGDVGKAVYRNIKFYPVVRLLVCTPKIQVDCRFATYWINSAIIEKNQTAVSQLTIQMLGELIFTNVQYVEQKKIADFLDKKTVQIDKLIQIKNQQIKNINKQRQTLIYDYVTGKRRGKEI